SGAALRVIPHPPNFAPIGAMALFGGAALPGAWAFAVPLAALVLSDAVLGFYQGWIWVYGSFALIVLIGAALRRRRTALRVAGAASHRFTASAAARSRAAEPDEAITSTRPTIPSSRTNARTPTVPSSPSTASLPPRSCRRTVRRKASTG